MKNRKKPVTIIKVAYADGVGVTAQTTHEIKEIQAIFNNAKKSNGMAIIDTVNNEEEVQDDGLVINVDKMLFMMVAKLNDSPIVVPESGFKVPPDLRIQ